MKLKNILIMFLTAFTLLLTNNVQAETTAPDSYTVDGKDIYKIDSSKYLPNGGFVGFSFHYKKNTNGQIIYCTESHDFAVTSGTQKYTLVKEMESKYAYVLANGYPYKSITGNDEKDYFITALSVFYLVNPNDWIFDFFDFDKGTYRGTESDVAKEIAKLVNGAYKYSYVQPTIKLNISNNNLTLSSDGKYYVSSSISGSTTGIVGKYTVSLEKAPSGTVVTDINGMVKNTFNTDEEFVVKVPVSSIKTLSSEFKINVSATGSIYKAYLYEPEELSYQNTATLYPENSIVSDTATLKINLTTEVQISKVDATTGSELPGAKLTVKDSQGNVRDSWVSTDEVHIIKGLEPGKYTLTEEIAPEGYILSTEVVTFEVKADGTVTKVVMENTPKENVPIYISKQDITTGEELAGAHLELKDENGQVIYAWVSDTTPHMIERLDPGKYYLTEILAPEGYELSTETVEFVVKEDGTVDGDIIMYNKPETIVEVPSTSSFKTITASLIGIIVIGLGSMIIYRNYKKNEEN